MSSSNIVTPQNYGPLVGVVSWVLLVVSVLATVTRIWIKLAISWTLSIDDTMLCVALLFSIGQTLVVSLQASNSLGRHIFALSTSHIDEFQKTAYASNLLYTTNVALAKLSIAALLYHITPVRAHKSLAVSLGFVTITWAVSALFTFAFQCHLPEPWELIGSASRCINMLAFWNYFEVVNILLEVALIATPIYMFWSIQINTLRKLTVMGCFATRVSVITAIIARTVYLNRVSSTDPSFDAWPTTLCLQFVQGLSIVTASVPYLKPFFISLESGMIRADDPTRQGLHSTLRYYYYGSKKDTYYSRSKSSQSSVAPKGSINLARMPPNQQSSTMSGAVVYDASLRGTALVEASGRNDGWDERSQTSQAGMIRETNTWAVDSIHEDHV